MTDQEMTALRNANLYHISGDDVAFPNFRYCKPDAPYYERVGGEWVEVQLPVADTLPIRESDGWSTSREARGWCEPVEGLI